MSFLDLLEFGVDIHDLIHDTYHHGYVSFFSIVTFLHEANMLDEKISTKEPPKTEWEDEAVALFRNALRGMQFGNVTAIVQDGFVVQIDRTEKRRINRKK